MSKLPAPRELEADPFSHRKVRLGELLLVATELAPGAHVVRVHPRPELPYHMLVGVAEMNFGQTICLVGLHGVPLRPKQWVVARDLLFPLAQEVRFERRDPQTGELSYHAIPLPIVGNPQLMSKTM